MSAPSESAGSALASTPAPSASTSALAGGSAPSAPAAEAKPAPASKRALDPHMTWEEYRASKEGKTPEPTPDVPRLTPDKMKAWLDAQRAVEPDDVEAGDAAEKTARAKEDVQALAAEATKQTEAAPEKAPRTFKVKMRGQEQDVPLDKYAALVKLSPAVVEYIAEHEGEHAAAQLYQRLHTGDEAAREHGTMKREMERHFAGLKGSPVDALEYMAKHPQIGFDLLDTAYQIVQRDIDTKALTPEARRLREVEGQLRQMEARDKAATAERERVLREVHETAERTRVETFFTDLNREVRALLAESGLPADDYHYGMIRAAMEGDMARQGDAYRAPVGAVEMRARAAEHIPAMKAQLKASLKALYGSGDKSVVQEFIADMPELHAAAAKARVAEFKKNSAAQANGKSADSERVPAPTQKARDTWLEDLRRRA